MKMALTLLLALGITASTPAAIPTAADKYEILSGEGLEGSGFVIHHANRFFGVATLHQFGGKSPSTLEPLEGDSIQLDRSQVWKQMDVQVLPVVAPSSNLPFLAYSPDFELRVGDEVILLGPAGDVITGIIMARGMTNGRYQSASGPRTLSVRANKPFLMAGGSGGPVIKKQTGSVIGVILAADDASQARIIGFQTLCFYSSPLVILPRTNTLSAQSPLPDPATERLVRVFPSIYWHAADACMRETVSHGRGHPQKHDDFIRDSQVTIETVSPRQSDGKNQVTIRLRLFDRETPSDYWLIDLSREGNQWRPNAGKRYIRGELAFDLFRDEFLLGRKIMGSMQPYLAKALEAYSNGKDFRSVFATTSIINSKPAPEKIRATQLVGSWRYQAPDGNLITSITYDLDGTFKGNVVMVGRKNWSFSGKWNLRDNTLHYEYTASSNASIPSGTKDEDQMISIQNDRYVIRNAFGKSETYIRIK